MTGFDIWNELGNIYFKVGAFDEAIDAYNKAIELDSRIGWLYSNLGFAYVHKGKLADAIPMYEKSLELLTGDTDKALSWSRLGDVYRDLQQPDRALDSYQKALELDPQNVAFCASLEALRQEIGAAEQQAEPEAPGAPETNEPAMPEQPQAGLPEFADDELPDEEPDAADMESDEEGALAADAFYRIFEQDGIPEPLFTPQASIDLESPIEPKPPLPGEQPTLGAEFEPLESAPAVAEMQAPETIVAVAEPANELSEQPAEAVETGPVAEPWPANVLEQDALTTANFNSLLSSGIEFWRKGDPEKASETLHAALEAAGKAENRWLEALSHNALALVKTELGKLEDAIDSYTQAMQLAPEKIVPWNNIGSLYSRLDRNDEAMGAFLKAIEHNPEDFVGWDGLGDIYAKAGRLNDAIAAYQLGNVFGKQRRVEDALTAYQMILEPEREIVPEKPEDMIWVPEVPEEVGSVSGEDMPQVEPYLAVEDEGLAEMLQPAGASVIIDVAEVVETPPVPAAASQELPEAAVVNEPDPVEPEVAAEAPAPVPAAEIPIESLPATEQESGELLPVEAIEDGVDDEQALDIPVAETVPALETEAAASVEAVVIAEAPLAEPEPVVEEPVVALPTVEAEPLEAVAQAVAESPDESAAALPAEDVVAAEPVVAAMPEAEPQVVLENEPVEEAAAEAVASQVDAVAVEQNSPEMSAQAASLAAEVPAPEPQQIVAEPPAENEAALAEMETVVTAEPALEPEAVVAVPAPETGVLPEVAAETTEDLEPVVVETTGDRIAAEMLAGEPPVAESVEVPAEEPVASEPVAAQAVAEVETVIEITEEVVVVEEPLAEAEEIEEVVETTIVVEETRVIEPAAPSERLPESVSSSIEQSRLASAIAAYRKVTEINPENDRAWDSLGNLYRASEHYDQAILAFERAIALHPDKEVYHYHLGLVYAAEKNYEAAIGAFQKVIGLNPEYTFAHCALAGYYRKLGREAEAQQHIEIAQPKMAGEKEYDRACFAAICGNADEAIELLKIALEKKQTSLDWVRRDPDLDFIREDLRFRSIVAHNGSWSERLSEVFTKQLAWSVNK